MHCDEVGGRNRVGCQPRAAGSARPFAPTFESPDHQSVWIFFCFSFYSVLFTHPSSPRFLLSGSVPALASVWLPLNPLPSQSGLDTTLELEVCSVSSKLSPVGSDGKGSACNTDSGLIPRSGPSSERGHSTQASILAWRIPWTEESTGSQRTRHDWSDLALAHFVQSLTTSGVVQGPAASVPAGNRLEMQRPTNPSTNNETGRTHLSTQ